MSQWNIYTGSESTDPHEPTIPEAPPWRRFPVDPNAAVVFRAARPVVEAVNAALHLRRPLLLTGTAGSGKSSLIDSVARELRLGKVLRWHVTSSSTLADALYRYDAIGRLHAKGLQDDAEASPPISDFLRLGPLGTALMPSARPRALLIDEIDKSDIDLPNDLLNIFERGEFEIPELARLKERSVYLKGHDTDLRRDDDAQTYLIEDGVVQCTEFPFVILTSNGERDFPAPFLRRCIRVKMPDPDENELAAIVRAHLHSQIGPDDDDLISERVADFLARKEKSPSNMALDQLLNAVYLVTGAAQPGSNERDEVLELLLKELTTDTS